jgi:LysM repeat protein
MVPGSVEAAGRWARGLPAGFSRAARSVIGALTLLAVVIVVPRWEQADQVAMTVRMDGPDNAAEQWLVSHVNHTARLIVVDQYWIYLIDHGFNHHPERGGFFSRTVVSYWPLDYDPAVKKAFPRGWREFNLVVVTQDMRDTLTQTPTAAAAIAHSRPVAVFGHGLQQVQIRLIAGTRLSTVLRGPAPRPRRTPSPAGPPEPHPGPTVPGYTVQPGDTLSGIAGRYRIRGGWAAIYQRNRGIVGRNPNVIYPGEHLTP